MILRTKLCRDSSKAPQEKLKSKENASKNQFLVSDRLELSILWVTRCGGGNYEEDLVRNLGKGLESEFGKRSKQLVRFCKDLWKEGIVMKLEKSAADRMDLRGRLISQSDKTEEKSLWKGPKSAGNQKRVKIEHRAKVRMLEFYRRLAWRFVNRPSCEHALVLNDDYERRCPVSYVHLFGHKNRS